MPPPVCTSKPPHTGSVQIGRSGVVGFLEHADVAVVAVALGGCGAVSYLFGSISFGSTPFLGRLRVLATHRFGVGRQVLLVGLVLG